MDIQRKRLTITINDAILKKIDNMVDGIKVRNRSHAIEILLSKVLREQGLKKAFILAGGKGTRMRPLTYEIPKPLIPLHGRPIIEHQIEHLKKFGIEEVILGLGYGAEKIIAHFADGRSAGVKIKYVVEKEELGTAGPMLLAKDYLDETFVMLNGDVLSKVDLHEMYDSHITSGAAATIALKEVDDPTAFGVAKLRGNKILKFIEKPKLEDAPSKLINAGVYILSPDVFKYLPENKKQVMMETDVFPEIAKDSGLYGYVYDGPWFDLGTPERYTEAIEKWK
ncbi:hypothetical protein BEH94_02650 [Candidatus Altiarchaeales archaeon WOR_SM1_SCG]|nr:hypothetical protein BEH94_02650 [Candidatus Altiarchaeales archaeon WOR_SM1_SCG]